MRAIPVRLELAALRGALMLELVRMELRQPGTLAKLEKNLDPAWVGVERGRARACMTSRPHLRESDHSGNPE